MENKKKSGLQLLMPVEGVPWQISPSTPYLRLVVEEDNAAAWVRFVGHFALLDTDSSRRNMQSIEVIRNPHSSMNAQDSQGFQLVEVSFSCCCWARMQPSFSDHQVIEEDLYDFREIDKFYGESGMDYEEYRKAWNKTGFCPNPRMYTVKNSSWVKNINSRGKTTGDLHHFLLLGHDVYIEVLAEKFSWSLSH